MGGKKEKNRMSLINNLILAFTHGVTMYCVPKPFSTMKIREVVSILYRSQGMVVDVERGENVTSFTLMEELEE